MDKSPQYKIRTLQNSSSNDDSRFLWKKWLSYSEKYINTNKTRMKLRS